MDEDVVGAVGDLIGGIGEVEMTFVRILGIDGVRMDG